MMSQEPVEVELALTEEQKFWVRTSLTVLRTLCLTKPTRASLPAVRYELTACSSLLLASESAYALED